MPQTDVPRFPFGNGGSATLIRQKNWSTSTIGPIENWSPGLRTTLSTCLHAHFPIVTFWGPDFVMLYNDAYTPLIGARHPAALGSPCREVLPEIWDIIGPMLEVTSTRGEATWSENQPLILNRYGYEETCYFTFAFSPIYTEQNEIEGVFCACTENTAVIRAARQTLEVNQIRQETTQRLQRLFEQAPVAIAILRGPRFVVELANPAICEVWNRRSDQLLGRPVFEVLTEAAGQGFEELLTGVLQTGIPFEGREMPVTFIRAGKPQPVFVNLVYEPLYEVGDDRVSGIVVVGTEVTESVQARERVEINERLLNAMIRQTPIGVAIFRKPDFVVERANPAVCRIWGRTPEQVLGKPLFEVLPEAAGQGFEELLTGVFESGIPFVGSELPAIIEREGRLDTVYFDFVYEPLLETDARIERIMVVATDATYTRQARLIVEEREASLQRLATELEERVQRRTQDLERSNLDLMQFASVASHDLREPLRKVQTFGTRLEELLAGRLSDEEADLFRRLVNATARMKTLVSDVLRLSILSDQTADFEAVDLNQVIAQIRDDLELIISERGAELTIDPLPTVLATPGQMHQLFQNLISNALKFSDSATPTIHIRSVAMTNELATDLALPTQQYVVLAVTDNGIGFDQKYEDKIFGMFQRLHGRSQYTGTGIGLTIVKKIVDNHRGFVDVRSQPGRGTTFQIALPSVSQGDSLAGHVEG